MSFEDRLRHDLQAPENLLPSADLADVALAGARRATRWRVAAAAGGVVTVLSVGAVTAPVWLNLRAGGGGAPPGSLGCAGAPLSPLTASPSWEQFDPLRYEIDARAVDGYQLSTYSTARYYQVAELANPAGDRQVTVTLYTADGAPHYRTPDVVPVPIDPATGEAADPVHGAPAYWLPEQAFAGLAHGEGLAWQWSPGAWVFVTVAALDPDGPTTDAPGDPAGLRGIVSTIAPQLQLGGGAPVTSPFAMTVPECTRVVGTRLMYGVGGVADVPFTRFGLVFGPEDYVDATNPLLVPGDGGAPITVDADTVASPDDKPGSVNSTVDGHPAADFGGFLVVYDVDGLALELSGPSGLFETITVYPGADADPTAWGAPVP